jgi:hypothetical protein
MQSMQVELVGNTFFLKLLKRKEKEEVKQNKYFLFISHLQIRRE